MSKHNFSGAYGDTMMSFGKYAGNKIAVVPNSYLSYLLSQDWFEEKDEFESVENEMAWRKEQGVFIED